MDFLCVESYAFNYHLLAIGILHVHSEVVALHTIITNAAAVFLAKVAERSLFTTD